MTTTGIFGRPGAGRGNAWICCSASPVAAAVSMTTRRLPKNWVIDWTRFVGVAPHDATDGIPARVARKIDTALAPPLETMVKEGNDEADAATEGAVQEPRTPQPPPWLQSEASHRPGPAQTSQTEWRGSVGSDRRRIDHFQFQADSCAISSRTRSPNCSSGRRCGSIFWRRRKKAAATDWAKWAVSSSRRPLSAFCWRIPIPRCRAVSIPPKVRCGWRDNSPINSIAKWMRFASVME